MKSLIFTVYATVFFSCFFGKAQVTRNTGGAPTNATPQTNPLNISQFEVSGRLITQNAFVGTTAIPAAQQTGNFGSAARWNSMGNLNFNATTPNLTQTLNGFRTQTDGRGLAWGHSIPAPGQPNAGVVSNSFIEWIGNNVASVAPGNLEFKYALSPTGAAAARVPIFTMAPATGFTPSFNYAETNAFVGQKQSGSFGLFGVGDTWSATGLIDLSSAAGTLNSTAFSYGARQEYEGRTLITGLIKANSNQISSVIDFGGPILSQSSTTVFKFRSFSDPTNQSSINNIWQSGNRFNNMVLGRQEYGAVNSRPFYLSLFDGQASNTSIDVLSFVNRAGIYATTDGNDEFGNPLNSYASIIGEIENPTVDFGQSRYAIAGLTSGNATGNIYAGYFAGNAVVTGNF